MYKKIYLFHFEYRLLPFCLRKNLFITKYLWNRTINIFGRHFERIVCVLLSYPTLCLFRKTFFLQGVYWIRIDLHVSNINANYFISVLRFCDVKRYAIVLEYLIMHIWVFIMLSQKLWLDRWCLDIFVFPKNHPTVTIFCIWIYHKFGLLYVLSVLTKYFNIKLLHTLKKFSQI